jgi:hypothetical protein
MSFSYQETAPGGKSFACNLLCERCAATTARGSQCSRTTCKVHPYCHSHLKSVMGLVVRPSGVSADAGDGLFAVRNFERGDLISVYYGEKLSQAKTSSRYGDEDTTGPYAVTSNLNPRSRTVIDAACVRSAAAYANDLVNSDLVRRADIRYNSEIKDVSVAKIPREMRHGARNGYLIALVATRQIPGTVANPVEIVTNYGRGYWASSEGYTSATHKKKQAGAMDISERNLLSPPHAITAPKKTAKNPISLPKKKTRVIDSSSGSE